MADEVIKTDKEWRQQLKPEQYLVTRQKGTEPPFTGEYYKFKGHGIYKCVCCGNDLFSSEAKFDSGTGWPSFWDPISETSIEKATDTSHGMRSPLRRARDLRTVSAQNAEERTSGERSGYSIPGSTLRYLLFIS